jgi:preprotein translocase subunit Sec61beta
MAASGNINIPSGMGGLVRYGEEAESRFMLKPAHVIGFVVLTVLFVLALRIFFPIA